MSNQERIQNVWEIADKSVIDIMTKKTCRSPVVPVSTNYSSDESSDSESVVSRYGPFVAVPKEFRPYLPEHREAESLTKNSLNENVQNLLVEDSKSAGAVPKIPLFRNQNPASVCKETFLSNPCQNEMKVLVTNKNSSKNTSFDKGSRVVSNTTVQNVESKEIEEKETAKEERFHQPKRKVNNRPLFKKRSFSKKPKHKTGLKYEYVEEQEHRTIQLTFKMPSTKDSIYHLKDGLKYEIKHTPNIRQQREMILEPTSNNSCNSFQESIVKWDSTLSLNNQDSNDQDQVEWSVIQEKKTFVSTSTVKGNKHICKQPNKECHPTLNNSNLVEKPKKKRHRQKKPSDNLMQDEINLNQQNEEKHIPKYSELNREECNTGTSFNNFNLLTKVQNSDAKHLDIDNERFTQQCKVSQQNLAPSLLNDSVISLSVRENFHIKSPLMDFNLRQNSNADIGGNIKLKEMEEKNSVLNHGREMLDFIIGSHTSLSLFIAMYSNWKSARHELIGHFEQLEKNLKESSKKFLKYKDMLEIVKTTSSLASLIPVPHASIAARVVSALTGLFSTFLSVSEKKTTEVEDSNDISTAISKDKLASSELYSFAIQCHTQFQETVKVIEEFHLNVRNPEIFEDESPEIATFIQGVLEYKPNHRIFYKKLYKCFQELQQTSSSDFSKRFCEPLSLCPSTAIEIIGILDWRFPYQDFNGESVRHELEQIGHLIEMNESTSVKDLINRTQICIRILRDELTYFEGCVKDLSLFSSQI